MNDSVRWFHFPNKNLVSHFIDCNCLPTSRCGGGPTEEGANSGILIVLYFLALKLSYLGRWNDNIQRAFYNGWKSIHGLKHQTVDNAFGFTEDIYGPTSLRHHDLNLLYDSMINNRFKALQQGNVDQYIVFGDSAYPKESHLTTYKERRDANNEHVNWNKAMKHVRISIEWNYGHTATLFKYVRKKDKLKLLSEARVAQIYTVATLFRNFHVACYGSQCSSYFGLEMPSDMLTHYINQTAVVW